MRKATLLTLAGAGLMLAAASGGASAAPTSGLQKLDLVPVAGRVAGQSGAVEQVHWRHHHWRHRYWGPRYGIYGGYNNCWWRYGRRVCRW